VALRRGAVPEIVVSGRTGIVVDHPSKLTDTIEEARALDPTACRKHVEASFTVRAMDAVYEATYRRAPAEIAALPEHRSDGPACQAVA
jgi:hypothetical protein